MRRHTIATLLVAMLLASSGVAAAAPEGTLTWGVHVTLATRWLDPNDTEAFITPFMVLYAIHDALVKPMPAGDNTPSLAESWTVSKDGLTYEFVLRRGVKFHNGDPVTAEDAKFPFGRGPHQGVLVLGALRGPEAHARTMTRRAVGGHLRAEPYG
jgi:peptide/nickel transport system substrate-binding protein